MTTTKKTTRIISILLVFIFSLSLAMSTSALTVTNKVSSSVQVLTYGNKFLKDTSTIKIKNTGSNNFKLTVSFSNCSGYIDSGSYQYNRFAKTITLSPGEYVIYKINTYWCKTGTTKFKVVGEQGYNASYSVTGKNYCVMSRA